MADNPLSMQVDLDPNDFLPASEEEKEYMVQMRPSSTFFRDGCRRLYKNKVALSLLRKQRNPHRRQHRAGGAAVCCTYSSF